MAKIVIVAGNTVIQPWRNSDGTEPARRRVTYEVTFDTDAVQELLKKAYANKSNTSRDGGVTVRITNHKEV